MKRKTQHLLAILGLVIAIAPVTAQAQYDYQSISYPGQASAQVFGINDSGDVVGTGFNPDNVPFVYSSLDGTITAVEPSPDHLATSLLAINDAGVMAGNVTDFDGLTGYAMIRSKKGEYTVFSHPDANSSTTARGINNKGLVSGTYDREDPQFGLVLSGFLYDPKNGTFTELVPSIFTIAHGINSKGVVAGDSLFDVNPCGGAALSNRYGWVRNTDGSVVLFQVNGQRTVARGINDAGKVVGNVLDPVAGQFKGFVIDAPETNCASIAVDDSALLAYPGAISTFPEGITNAGEIVGIFVDEFNNSLGFIATTQ